jgi:serine/threonine-protein kinase
MSRPKDERKVEIKRNEELIARACYLVFQACNGIGYAHRMHLVHCDVKPHNMLVTRDWRLKVTDFGIARALSTILPDERADVVWGSPQYFSPEQAVGEAPSPASDVYSLGVVLYEVLTGALPFTAPTSEELALLHLQADPIPLHEYVPDIPSALEEIVMKVLSKEPSARYRTADQLGRVLLRFGTQQDIPVAPALNLTPEAATTYRQPDTVAQAATVAAVARRSEPRPEPLPPPPVTPAPATTYEEIDWTAVVLGLLALLMVGSLVPFWIYIYFLYNPR